jgi:chaperonin cofactor prefoldin
MEETKSKEEIIKFLQNLPDGRKIYYNFGTVLVEITKEEAIKLLKEEGES